MSRVTMTALNISKCWSRFQGISVCGQLLESVNEVRDLVVQLTAGLKQSKQCQLVYSTASRVLGMISRTISYRSSEVMLRLYKSLVRPHVEFCVSAWSPS